MSWIPYILTGGFAKGYRTYILSGVAVVGAVAAWSIGDMDTIHMVIAVTGALGLNTAAHH